MALTKEEKDWCFKKAVSLAEKVAEGGGIDKGAEIANTIRFSYEILIKLAEEKNAN